MKQAEVTYKVYGKVAEVVGYKNILTYREIISAVGRDNAEKYITEGAHFYLVSDVSYLKSNGYRQEFVRVGTYTNEHDKTRTFSVGSTFPVEEMRYIISLMKDAGNRLSRTNTVTVKI